MVRLRVRSTPLTVVLCVAGAVALVVVLLLGRALVAIDRPDTALTAVQEAQPYAEYFDRAITAPGPALEAAVAQPMDCADALPINEIDTLLEPGYQEVETGYCLFDDGGGYASANIDMPGVTLEMVDWWFAWHPQEPLRYELWDRDDHFDVQISDADRTRLNDTSLPMAERLWGTTHHVREDIGVPTSFRLLQGAAGTDPYAISIHFVPPQECGFDMTVFDVEQETVICADSGMRHYVRETADGVELRTRFYSGYVEEDGTFVREGSATPVAIQAGLNRHMIEEFSNLAGFLPELYAQEGPDAA